MNKSISDTVRNLRNLQWDQSINYLINDFFPNLTNQISNENNKELMVSFNELLNLIFTAINNHDVILLCDLLEYELVAMFNKYKLE